MAEPQFRSHHHPRSTRVRVEEGPPPRRCSVHREHAVNIREAGARGNCPRRHKCGHLVPQPTVDRGAATPRILQPKRLGAMQQASGTTQQSPAGRVRQWVKKQKKRACAKAGLNGGILTCAWGRTLTPVLSGEFSAKVTKKAMRLRPKGSDGTLRTGVRRDPYDRRRGLIVTAVEPPPWRATPPAPWRSGLAAVPVS